MILVSALGPNPSFFHFWGLLFDLGACWDSDLDQGLTIMKPIEFLMSRYIRLKYDSLMNADLLLLFTRAGLQKQFQELVGLFSPESLNICGIKI